jgi:CheY-like chemotaxis protein
MNKQHAMVTQEIKQQHELVMLVDDSAIDNFVNKKIITRYQFAKNIIEFTRSAEALNYLINLSNNETEQIPSVLFLDLDLPEINGFEFLDSFDLLPQRIKTEIKIVILTSSINPADSVKCNTHGSVLTFIHKPLVKHNLDELEDILLKKMVN